MAITQQRQNTSQLSTNPTNQSLIILQSDAIMSQ
jgi:hypothetical protein